MTQASKRIKDNFRVHASSSKDFTYKFESSNFVSFVFESRFKDKLDTIKQMNKKRDKLKELLRKYEEKLSKFQIRIKADSSDLTKYIFILALADFWQEWGRVTFTDKGMASIGVRMSIPKDDPIEIIVPFIAYSKTEYLRPLNFPQMNQWQSNPINQLIGSEKYFKDMSDKEIKIAIREHIESYISGKDEEEARQAVFKQNMLKLWEYVHKFSSFNNLKGTFTYKKNFLSIIWKGIRDHQDSTIDFRWPK